MINDARQQGHDSLTMITELDDLKVRYLLFTINMFLLMKIANVVLTYNIQPLYLYIANAVVMEGSRGKNGCISSSSKECNSSRIR